MANTVGVCINLENVEDTDVMPVTQYGGYNFSSLCNFNDVILGSNENGIYVLMSGDSDDGTDIDAYFQTPSMDFASYRSKRIRSVKVDGWFDGGVEVAVTLDDDPQEYVPITHAGESVDSSVLIYTPLEHYAMNVGVIVRNIDSSDFGIISIDAHISLVTFEHHGNLIVGSSRLVCDDCTILGEGNGD